MPEDSLKTTEAQRRASLKWEQENNEKITIKLRVGKDPSKEQIRHAAEQAGMSVNQWILATVRERLGRLYCSYPSCEAASAPMSAQQAVGAALTPETMKRAQEAAAAAGETVEQFIARAVEVQTQRDELGRSMLR